MKTLISKSAALFAIFALLLSGVSVRPAAAQTVLWDVTGDYQINMEYLGVDYAHDMSLEQDAEGNLSGEGGSPAGANVYTWEITSGSIDGDSIEFDANYTATSDAVTPQTVLHVEGTIAEDGSISGTWSDNYQGGERSGTWETTAGAAVAVELPESVTVTIVKYVDGEVATAESADSDSFAMNATWDADNIGSGSGSFSLGTTGFNNANAYYATTTDMSPLASYSVSEVLDDQTGASCDVDGVQYALTGYSTGDTLEEAENADITDEASLTGITSDKYIIVWNDDCSTPETPETVKVTIVKYVDGELATSTSTGGDSFAMNATWDADNIGSGSGTFSLAADNATAYTAVTTDLSAHADYSTSEVLNAQTGESCDVDGVKYGLVGYLIGDTLEDAEDATITQEVSLTDLTSDRYVIVLNDLCATEDDDGTIGGDVEGTGELEVTSIETLDGTAVADGTYENGWKFRFNITVPTDETALALRFGNWTENGDGDGTIATANNMRISSAQADSDATVTVTAADTYTSSLNINEDLDAEEDGLQVQVLVEVRIPEGTDSGSYTTSYGVRSE